MNDLYYGAEGAEEAAAILCQLDTNSTEDLPSTISRLLLGKDSRGWTEDDVLECMVRVIQTIQYRPPSTSRYWCIREIDERTCHIELLNEQPDQKLSVYSTMSRDDPAVELAEFKLSIPGMSTSDCFHRVLKHSADNWSVACTEYCSGNYHVIPTKIGFKLTEMSGSCLKVQVPTLAELSVSIQDVEEYNTSTRNYPQHSNNRVRMRIPLMSEKIPAILDHVRRVWDGHRGIVEIVRKQINREKQERIRRIVQARLQGTKTIVHDVEAMNQANIAQEKRMDELETRVKTLETSNAVFSSKLQFEKVLGEMKRREFEKVLVLIGQAQREAKATELGFGKVLHEMKKKNFALLLDQISAARREAKAAGYAERFQQRQMEAQELQMKGGSRCRRSVNSQNVSSLEVTQKVLHPNMPRLSKHELDRCRERRQQWLDKFLPRVRAAKRPNAVYLENPEVLELLQHISDGVNELLLARPLSPLPWLADYLRRACKLGYEVQNTVAEGLILEMHRKRRVIQSALRDTKLEETESKRLIQKIITLEKELKLVGRERRLKRPDHAFFVWQQPSLQSNWSIGTSKVPLFPEKKEKIDRSNPNEELEIERQWLSEQLGRELLSQRDRDAYFDLVVDKVIRALVNLLLTAPEKPALWFVLYLRHPIESPAQVPPKSPPDARRKSSVALSAASPQLFKTNFELTRKLDEIKEAQREMHIRLQTMQQIDAELERELATRNRFVTKLSETHVTTRTQAIMDGTPVFLNSQKHWVLPGHLLTPQSLSVAELQGLRRAECFLMEKDETHWKFLLRAQLEFDSATLIQSVWKGGRAYRAFKELQRRRRRAAIVIQRNYFHYLFTRATSLPRWCRPGREVVVAPSIAQKCAISFQFYPKRDFPAGNYRREPEGTSLTELMEVARQNEMCAGFTTDGALKRFLPRMLSQLKPMEPRVSENDEERDREELTAEDGLYVKLFPKKDEELINSAIIVEVPADRFGLIRVVLDGIAITELVPISKLTDRWKRIRVKRVISKERRKTRAVVFGKGTPCIMTDGGENDSPIVEPGTPDTTYQRIESDEEEMEESIEQERRRQRRLRRQRMREDDDNPDYIFEDLVTGRIMRRGHPNNTHEDPKTRDFVIATRKKEYEDEKCSQFEEKKRFCAVKIQCAWRSKRAREHFHQILVLRGKEREHERLVDRVGAARRPKVKKRKKGGLFSKFR